MTKYFMSGTPLAELERIMMTPPRPHYRNAPSYISNPAGQPNGKEVVYWQLVKKTFSGLSSGELWQRIREVSGGKEASQFLNKVHGKRMTEFCLELWKGMDGKPSSLWLAAIFLLTSSEKLWSCARGCIHCYGIDFGHIVLGSVSLQEYVLYQSARSIWDAYACISVADLADRRLVEDSTLSLIVDAAVISRYGTVRFPDEKEAE